MFGVHALTQKDITKLTTSSLCTLVNCGMKMLCYFGRFPGDDSRYSCWVLSYLRRARYGLSSPCPALELSIPITTFPLVHYGLSNSRGILQDPLVSPNTPSSSDSSPHPDRHGYSHTPNAPSRQLLSYLAITLVFVPPRNSSHID
jgi:hypothetical protein